jgi:hypothetical protein
VFDFFMFIVYIEYFLSQILSGHIFVPYWSLYVNRLCFWYLFLLLSAFVYVLPYIEPYYKDLNWRQLLLLHYFCTFCCRLRQRAYRNKTKFSSVK